MKVINFVAVSIIPFGNREGGAAGRYSSLYFVGYLNGSACMACNALHIGVRL